MFRPAVLRTQSGVTLIELLVGIAIFAIVTTGLLTILLSTARLSTRTTRRADIQGSTRQAIALMTTELRQAGADPSIPPVGVVAIASADSISLRVRADLNGDGVLQTTEPSEDVTYAYVPSTRVLSRNPGTGPSAVASNITSLRFTYFDDANAPLTVLPLSAQDAARVRSIGIQLTGEESDSHPITLSTRITLRNR